MRVALLALTLLALSAAAAGQDIFQEGTTVTIKLMNGDTLTGLLEDADEARLVIHHDIFGRLEIPRAAIQPTPPEPAVEPVEPWSGKFDLSLSGSVGNTETQNFRTQLDAKHEDEESVDTLTFWMRRSESRTDYDDNPDTTGDPPPPGDEDSDTDVTEEKKFVQWRHEWKLAESKWRPFVQSSWETDQFTDYNDRLSVAAGGAYQFSEGPVHKVAGRVGAGFSHKSGLDDNEVEDNTWEALLGLDWFWTINELSSFTLVTDLYPAINPSGEYRAISKAAYERKLDEDSAWFLKLGLDHFYDSDAGEGKKPNDYNYFLGLGRTF